MYASGRRAADPRSASRASTAARGSVAPHDPRTLPSAASAASAVTRAPRASTCAPSSATVRPAILTRPEPERGRPVAAGGVAARSAISPVPFAPSTSHPVVAQRSEPSAREATGTSALVKAAARAATSTPSTRTRTSVPAEAHDRERTLGDQPSAVALRLDPLEQELPALKASAPAHRPGADALQREGRRGGGERARDGVVLHLDRRVGPQRAGQVGAGREGLDERPVEHGPERRGRGQGRDSSPARRRCRARNDRPRRGPPSRPAARRRGRASPRPWPPSRAGRPWASPPPRRRSGGRSVAARRPPPSPRRSDPARARARPSRRASRADRPRPRPGRAARARATAARRGRWPVASTPPRRCRAPRSSAAGGGRAHPPSTTSRSRPAGRRARRPRARGSPP